MVRIGVVVDIPIRIAPRRRYCCPTSRVDLENDSQNGRAVMLMSSSGSFPEATKHAGSRLSPTPQFCFVNVTLGPHWKVQRPRAMGYSKPIPLEEKPRSPLKSNAELSTKKHKSAIEFSSRVKDQNFCLIRIVDVTIATRATNRGVRVQFDRYQTT